jgi:hypothetical protein
MEVVQQYNVETLRPSVYPSEEQACVFSSKAGPHSQSSILRE